MFEMLEKNSLNFSIFKTKLYNIKYKILFKIKQLVSSKNKSFS